MAYLVFDDERGDFWEVWETRPEKPHIVAAELREGWLTFLREPTKVRLAPIPEGWEAADAATLRILLRQAEAGARDPTSAAAAMGQEG